MRRRPAALIPLFLALLAGLLLAVGLPAQAKASPKAQCWLQILTDWTKHGSITGTYPIHCYQEALRNLPEDVRDYSSAADDIAAALQKRLRERAVFRRTQGVEGNNGNATGGTNSGSGGTAPNRSLYRRAIDNLGTNSASSLPLPVLILAGLGGLLLVTAAGTAATKRIRAHRAKPPGA